MLPERLDSSSRVHVAISLGRPFDLTNPSAAKFLAQSGPAPLGILKQQIPDQFDVRADHACPCMTMMLVMVHTVRPAPRSDSAQK